VVHKKGSIPTDLVPVWWRTETLRPASRDVPITWDYGNCGAPNRETDVYLPKTSTSVLIDVWDDTRRDVPVGTACAGVSLNGTATVHLAKAARLPGARAAGDRSALMHAGSKSLLGVWVRQPEAR
jgi:hypothetical protein